MSQVFAAVTVISEAHRVACHLMSYEEGYPETIGETLLNMMGQSDFVGIENVLVDVWGDYSDVKTIGRKAKRIREEVLKLRDIQARIYHGEDGDDTEEHY